jgi:hypothetical protein
VEDSEEDDNSYNEEEKKVEVKKPAAPLSKQPSQPKAEPYSLDKQKLSKYISDQMKPFLDNDNMFYNKLKPASDKLNLFFVQYRD